MKNWSLFILLFAIIGCVEQPTFDPCKSVTATNADFSTYVNFISSKELDTSQFEADTFYGANDIRFKVKDKTVDSCFWKIGNDLRTFKEKDFQLSFDENIGKIGIKLVVKKQISKICFPQDNGENQKSKLISFLPLSVHPIIGQYRGENNEFPGKFYTVTIYLKDKNSNSETFIHNFPDGSNLDSISSNFQFNRIRLISKYYFHADAIEDSKNDASLVQVDGYLSPDEQELTIKYNRSKFEIKEFPKYHNFIFKGIKIK